MGDQGVQRSTHKEKCFEIKDHHKEQEDKGWNGHQLTISTDHSKSLNTIHAQLDNHLPYHISI